MLQELWLKIEEAVLVGLRSFQELPRGKRIVLLVCAVTFIPGFFVAKYGSYAFWNFQYRQYRVQAQPSFQSAQEVVVEQPVVIANPNSTYTAIAKLTNPNLDVAFQGGTYEMTLFNSQGEALRVQRGSVYMLPDQEKYIVMANIQTSDAVARATVTLSNVSWQKKSAIPEITLQTTTPNTYESVNPLEFVAEGVVVNDSAYRLGAVRLTFLLYDASGVVVGASERNEFSVRPHERRAYVQRWPNVYKEEVARVEVRAETNALSGNNLVLEDLPGSTSSDLSRPESEYY